MWAIGTLGMLENPQAIYACKNRQGKYDIYAVNTDYRVLLEDNIVKTDLKKIMLNVDFSLRAQEQQDED